MRILAIETVGTRGSVAALQDDRLVSERALNAQQRSAQSLAPAIDALLRELSWRPLEVGLVAVATGPGSFTGLRIGVTTAKLFAYAVDADVIGVNTLEVIASRAPQSGTIVPVLDAGRGELYYAEYCKTTDRLTEEKPTQLIARDQWLAQLRPDQVVTGPGLAELREALPNDVQCVEPSLWEPTAASVGQLGWRDYAAGRRDSALELVPHYHRRTAAEEQWERRAAT